MRLRPLDSLPSRSARDGGAVAVEFAIVIPVLLLILFGIIDFGRAMFVKNTLSYAAAQGARAAAVHADTSTVQGLVISTATNGGVTGMAGAGTSPTFDVSSFRACPADVPGAPDTATSSVTVRTNFKWVTPVSVLEQFGGSKFTDTITATATWLCVKTT